MLRMRKIIQTNQTPSTPTDLGTLTTIKLEMKTTENLVQVNFYIMIEDFILFDFAI